MVSLALVESFTLFYAQHVWNLKQRKCPTVCASATEMVLHFLLDAMLLQAEQKCREASPKEEGQGALAQLRDLCAYWESSCAPCSAGLGHQHCSLGDCVHNACWFIVLAVIFHSSAIQNTFGEWGFFYWPCMLTPYCRLFFGVFCIQTKLFVSFVKWEK